MSALACNLVVVAGTQPELVIEFKDADDNYADPTAFEVRTQSPSGVPATYTFPGSPQIVKDTTTEPVGVYRFTFPGALTEIGTWLYSARGTAGLIAYAEGSLAVKKAKF